MSMLFYGVGDLLWLEDYIPPYKSFNVLALVKEAEPVLLDLIGEKTSVSILLYKPHGLLGFIFTSIDWPWEYLS